jgi:hypothetical protein
LLARFLLGTLIDKDLARRLGRPIQSVRQRRNSLGIAPFTLQPMPWTNADDRLLGTMPDAELAARLGRSKMAVELRRLHRKISPFRQTGA